MGAVGSRPPGMTSTSPPRRNINSSSSSNSRKVGNSSNNRQVGNSSLDKVSEIAAAKKSKELELKVGNGDGANKNIDDNNDNKDYNNDDDPNDIRFGEHSGIPTEASRMAGRMDQVMIPGWYGLDNCCLPCCYCGRISRTRGTAGTYISTVPLMVAHL